MSWRHTLKLLENVPGMKLVFDTGNPVLSDDYSQPPPRPKQSAWMFYSQVRERVAHVHVKDGMWDKEAGRMVYTYAGEGQGDVRRILGDLLDRGYDGGVCIEPHLTVVLHEQDAAAREQNAAVYVEYGRRLMKMVEELQRERAGR